MKDIEKFPVTKRQIRPADPPELIFFDVDEDADEADFIRVDDLFRDISDSESKEPGAFTFTLIPFGKDRLIDSRSSRIIHRTMILTAFRLQHPIEKIRIRPLFVQWQLTVEAQDEPEYLVREFRADLEDQFRNLQNMNENEKYWADTCFICPASAAVTDEWIREMAAAYQKE